MAESKKERLRRGARHNFSTPHIKPVDAAVSAQGDPLHPVTITLTLDDLTTYDRNPRRSQNTAWDAIVNETRALKGLDGVLAVTRRPGETRYFPRRGGNTRLLALRQLWEETGDKCYFHIDCKVYPWAGEAEVLTAHLSDNDNRGGVSFIDRARGIRDLKQALEEELGEPLSNRALAQQLTTRGYRISHPLLSFMDYALDTLQPCIPVALAAGLGRPKVEALRKIHTTLRQRWAERHPDVDSFESFYRASLSEHDGEGLDLHTIENALREQTDKKLNSVSPAPPHASSNTIIPDNALHESPPSEETRQALRTSKPNQQTGTPGERANKNHSSVNTVNTPSSGDAPSPTARGIAVSAPLNFNPSGTIQTLRKQNFILARRAADKTDVQKYVYPVDYAYGYVMDVPFSFLNPASVDASEQTATRTAQYLYHHLLALAENQISIEVVKAMPFHAEAIKYIKRGADYFNEKVRQFAPPPHQVLAGSCLFNAACYLADDQLFALFQITINNRAIRRLADDPYGSNLYPPPPADEQLGLDPEQFPELFKSGGRS